ncbi:MAG: SH3 domain-containing protein [Tabrizicola sp.]|nr:SH3 domain-containing protein [Tabrizicola sp.]
MLRLTLMLCAVMFGALLIAGEDRGQLRPGLAKAAAEGAWPPKAEPEPVAVVEPEKAVVTTGAPVTPKPVTPKDEVLAASYTADPAPAKLLPAAKPRETVMPAPVFTLSTLQTRIDETATAEEAPAETVVAPEGSGTIWYVTADSVNVRSGPSTDTDVVGKLYSGEATMVVWQENDDWARIVIQGDGVEGFVATRFLSQSEP